MRGGPITDREAYPAAWITLAALAAAFLIWVRTGEPTVQPLLGCGALARLLPRLRRYPALIALAHAQLGTALRYHPPVVITLALAGAYLLTQTVWRLRGRRGWALHYRPLVAGGHRGAVPGQLSGAERPVAGLWDRDVTGTAVRTGRPHFFCGQL